MLNKYVAKKGEIIINTIVINDNIASSKKIKEMISQKEELNLIADYKNPIKFLDQLERDKKEFELIIMDTKMMGYSGIEVAKQIWEFDNNIEIIFITANQDYAVDAFEVDAFDYLVWPFSEERFDETISRLEKY